MNILQISQSFYPCFDSGGVVRAVYEISKELVAQGHDVTVYTTDGCTKRLDVEKNEIVTLDGIKVYYFSNLSNKLKIRLKVATPYHLFKIIRSEIKNFDIIHIHEHRTFLAIIVHYYAKKNNIPYIVQAHGSVMPTFQKTFLKKLFDKLWGNNILKDASNLIALTETESEQYKLMGIFENKITIVPNGINLLDYQKIPKKGEFRKKYNIKNNEKIILYLGRIHKNKGIELLLDAFSIVLENDEKFRLVIVGPDDGFLDHIKELTKTLNLNKNVLFTGPIYENDKAEVYVDSDIFVTPSYSGLPITFLESCAYGIPIITTSNGDKLDWINNNVGYVVKYDKYLLSNAILNLISNESLKNKFGYNGKTLVRTNFNWEIITQYIEKIYHEIIG